MPSTIDIDRLHAKVLVASDHPAPESVASRLEETAARHLGSTLRSIFTPWLSDSDTGIWMVRRLDLDVHVNLAREPESVARTWAAEIAKVIGPVLRGTGDGGNVVWFPDPAAYLARFLVDTAGGAAHGRWYFNSFAGLAALPMSATIRTAVCDDPALGLLALTRLDDECERVIRALAEHDAQIILEAFASTSPGTADGAAAAWRAWRHLAARRAPAGGDWHRALRVFVAARLEDADVEGPALRDAALAIVRLIRRAADPAIAPRLAAELRAGTMGDPAFAPLLRADPPLRREIADDLLGRASDTIETPVVRHTEFGGAFVLLPILAEMPLVEATEGWPHTDECASISLVRFLALAKCFGPERSLRALGDSLLQELMLLPVGFDAEALAEWCGRIEPQHLKRFKGTLRSWAIERGMTRPPSRADVNYLRLDGSSRVTRAVDDALGLTAILTLRAFARRLPGFGESTPEYLHANFLCFPASLEHEPERRVVRLARAPLHLVLSMSGLVRGEYRLPWLGDRPFTLFQEA